jgi:hypothetical protein
MVDFLCLCNEHYGWNCVQMGCMQNVSRSYLNVTSSLSRFGVSNHKRGSDTESWSYNHYICLKGSLSSKT